MDFAIEKSNERKHIYSTMNSSLHGKRNNKHKYRDNFISNFAKIFRYSYL